MKITSFFGTLVVIFSVVHGTAFAAPEIYTVDSGHTFARFSYSHFGFSTQLSRFNKTTGTVVLDPVAKTGVVDVSIDMKSVDTGLAIFNSHIQGEDFLDTEKYPAATFKSTKVVFDGDKPKSIEGDLTIKDVTKPVTLNVSSYINKAHPISKRDAIGADATVVIKRSDFHAGKFAPNVGDDVTISIALEAQKQ
jgi:polyisoprenoid-binding protein YceI